MATTRFTITYDDGTSESFKVKPRHLIAYEDEVGDVDKATKAKDAFKLAWIASGSGLSFEEWIDTVDDIDNPDAVAPAAEVAVDGGAAEAVPTE